jgi:hypothetical protein
MLRALPSVLLMGCSSDRVEKIINSPVSCRDNWSALESGITRQRNEQVGTQCTDIYSVRIISFMYIERMKTARMKTKLMYTIVTGGRITNCEKL